MLLLDITGSMTLATSATMETPRKDTVQEAISVLVQALAAEDSQAEHEQDGEGGGLRTVTFAGKSATDIGDLNPQNLRAKWRHINWGGTTWIMPGWNKLMDVYREEFGSKRIDEQPTLMALVITDGEAEDNDAFAAALSKTAGKVYCVIAVIGFGPEHDKATAKYNAIAQGNKHVRVIPFHGETNPHIIAEALKQMIN